MAEAQHLPLKATLPEPQQVRHGVFGAGQDHQVRLPEFARLAYIADGHPLHRLQGPEVGEVRKPGQADDGDIDELGRAAGEPLGQAVLIVDIQPHIGHHPRHGNVDEVLQLSKAGGQNALVPPKLVDDDALDHGALLLVEKGHGAVQLGEHPAPVDVPHQQHGGFGGPGHAHVHEHVVVLQVDLRRAPRPLDDDDVVFDGKGVVGLHDLRQQLPFNGEILPGAHLAPDLSMDDDLGAHIVGGLEQDGVHEDRGLHPRRLRLDHLGPAHLQALPCDE